MVVFYKNEKFPCEIMDTEEKIKKGMMGRSSLNGCMVFLLEKGYHTFWMKNCLIPLDIVFVNNKIISKIHTNCPPCNDDCSVKYSGIGDIVIEFPSGTCTKWKIGDKISFI